MEEYYIQVAEKILEQGRNIVFTGAGISTESGIPDYRSKGGLWEKFQPVYFDDFMSSRDARIEYWRRKNEMYHEITSAGPNAAHRALADMYEKGLIDAVITQNIDGLHQKSGIPDDRIIELHGNTLRVRCMSCDRISGIEDAHNRIENGDSAPECECGGYLKPDTISFGQAMPTALVQQATDLAESADLCMVIGSTLLVQPAASIPAIAGQNNAFIVMINLSETQFDRQCDVLIHEKAGEALEKIMHLVSAGYR